MAITDVALHVGTEGTYGTPVAFTRSFEAQSDPFKTKRDFMESVGFRAGMLTTRSDRRVIQDMGADGTIELDVLNKGMGQLLQGLIGPTGAPVQQASTIAYLQTYNADAIGPVTSWTMQMIRTRAEGGGNDAFTHFGCVATGWKLKQAVDQILRLEIDIDARTTDTVTAPGTATYPATTSPFHWGQCAVTVNSVAFEPRSIEFSAELAAKTDRRYLASSFLKRKPVRAAVPTYSGKLEWDYNDRTQYDAFVAGTVFPIVFTWTGALIVAGHNYQLTLTMPACQYTGESPSSSLTELTDQPLPFRVLHDGTNPPVTLTYKSTDVTV